MFTRLDLLDRVGCCKIFMDSWLLLFQSVKVTSTIGDKMDCLQVLA
jgi:hypothetical protein